MKTRTVRLLIEAGADVNQATNNEDTPLHVTCESTSVKIATILIRAGADVNRVDKNGHVPLFVACLNLNVVMVRFLLTFVAESTLWCWESWEQSERFWGHKINKNKARKIQKMLLEERDRRHCHRRRAWLTMAVQEETSLVARLPQELIRFEIGPLLLLQPSAPILDAPRKKQKTDSGSKNK